MTMADHGSSRRAPAPDLDLLTPAELQPPTVPREAMPELPPPAEIETHAMGDYVDMGAANTPFPPSPDEQIAITNARNALSALPQAQDDYFEGFEDAQPLVPDAESTAVRGGAAAKPRDRPPVGRRSTTSDWSDAAADDICMQAAATSEGMNHKGATANARKVVDTPPDSSGPDSPNNEGLVPQLQYVRHRIGEIGQGDRDASAKKNKEPGRAALQTSLEAEVARQLAIREEESRRVRQKERQAVQEKLDRQYKRDLALATENSLRDVGSQKKEKRVGFRLPPQEDEPAQSQQWSTSQDQHGSPSGALSEPNNQGRREVAPTVESTPHVTMAQVHVNVDDESSDEGTDPNTALRRARRAPSLVDLERRVARTVTEEMKAPLDSINSCLTGLVKNQNQVLGQLNVLKAYVYGTDEDSLPAVTEAPQAPPAAHSGRSQAPPAAQHSMAGVPVGPPGNPAVLPAPPSPPTAAGMPSVPQITMSPTFARSFTGSAIANEPAMAWSSATKLEPFDGNCDKAATPVERTIEVERWFQQVEMAANPPSCLARINLARFTAKGDAWQFVNGPHLKYVTKWDEFKRQVRMEFRGDLSPDMCLAQLAALKMMSGETPRNYLRRVKSMVNYIKDVHPDAIGTMEYTVLEHFLNGLPPWIGNWVRFQKGITSYDDAEIVASKMFGHREAGSADGTTIADWKAGGPAPAKRQVQVMHYGPPSYERRPVQTMRCASAEVGEPAEGNASAPTTQTVECINGVPRPPWNTYPIKPGRERGPHYPHSERTGRYCKYHDSPWHPTDTCRSPWTECRVCEGATHVWTACPWFQDQGRAIEFSRPASSRNMGQQRYGYRPRQVNAARADPDLRVYGPGEDYGDQRPGGDDAAGR